MEKNFQCLEKKNNFYKRLISKKHLLEVIIKIGASSRSDNISHSSTRLDRLSALIFFNYFESELFLRYGPFIKSVSLIDTHKNVSEQSL